MARETKVGLLVGLCFVLLIGILISDQLSVGRQQEAAGLNNLTNPAPHSTRTYGATADAPPVRPEPIPMPQEARGDRETPPPLHNRDMLLTRTERPHPYASHDQVVTEPSLAEDMRVPGQPTPRRLIEPAPRQSPSSNVRTHTVEPGENLTQIARKYFGDGQMWRSIRDANPDKISDNGMVRAGDILTIPEVEQSEPAGSPERTYALESTGLFDRVPAPTPTTERAPVTRQSPQLANTARTVVVAPGDTLSQIASRELGTATRWRELLDANRDQMDTDTDLRSGMVLRMPSGAQRGTLANNQGTARPQTYTVRRGDSLSKIAEERLGDRQRWEVIYEANRSKINDPARVPVGLVLVIP